MQLMQQEGDYKMSPLLAKFIVIITLVFIILLVGVLIYFIYKLLIKPLLIKTFVYKQVLLTAQIILHSEKSDKVENLIKQNIKDIDLIRIAEEELLKAKIKVKTKKIKKNLGLIEIFKQNIWRKRQNGEEKSFQQSRREDKGEIEGEQKERRQDRSGDLNRRSGGEEYLDSSSESTEQRTFQAEQSRTKTEGNRYFY